jgi:hypothetical protein
MDIFDQEILKFWKALNINNVKYIMVGALATNIHGFQRFTADIDVWIEDTIQNRQNLILAFCDAEIGHYPILETLQFVPGWTTFNLNNGLQLDLLTNMKGLENYSFDECLEKATTAEIENCIVPFLHINQLIENKKVVNRPKDQIDVLELEKIRDGRNI